MTFESISCECVVVRRGGSKGGALLIKQFGNSCHKGLGFRKCSFTFAPSFPAAPGRPCSPGGPGGPGWPRSPIGPVSPVGPYQKWSKKTNHEWYNVHPWCRGGVRRQHHSVQRMAGGTVWNKLAIQIPKVRLNATGCDKTWHGEAQHLLGGRTSAIKSTHSSVIIHGH